MVLYSIVLQIPFCSFFYTLTYSKQEKAKTYKNAGYAKNVDYSQLVKLWIVRCKITPLLSLESTWLAIKNLSY